MEQQFDFFASKPTPPPKPSGSTPTSSRAGSLDAAFRRTAEYERYMRSAKWRNVREQMFKLRGKKCERCDATTDLELHHKTYERFGNELPSDLAILCKPHHEIADWEREQRNQREFEELCENTRYGNARDTFLTKKYGENYYDDGYMSQEFDEWLERKREDSWYS